MECDITVVTVCKEAVACIETTMKSVVLQDYDNYEYIIVDGNSKDGTVEAIYNFIENFSKKIYIKIISEDDTGIYNAMNKSIDIARGKWIIFMNAGDTFVDNHTLAKFMRYIKNKNVDADFVYGDSYYIDQHGRTLVKGRNIASIKKKMPFSHQSMFNKRISLKKLKYNETYLICGDYDAYMRAYCQGYKFLYMPIQISDFMMDGYTKRNRLRYFKEMAAIKKNAGFISFEKLYCMKMLIYSVLADSLKKILPNRIIENFRKKIYG